jgi:site-specific recombinase XerD
MAQLCLLCRDRHKRHTYAQQLLENGASIYEIKEMMGHESIETTKGYLSINIRHMREVLFEE